MKPPVCEDRRVSHGATTSSLDAITSSGRVRGVARPGSIAFLGIPFAAPPVGPLRFAAPTRHEAWEGVRPAAAYAATAQRRPFGELTTIPEPSIAGDSTLNVNVFTPAAGDTDALLPVYVWIHGGGFFAGSPASPWYDGRSFNRDGIVTVSLSYRLGFDGFGWIDGAPLNRGILDQIAALEWVQENIGAFGGDPARVTIGGQSAGGGSVFALMSAPRAQRLFHGAIAHSGVAPSMTTASAEQVGRAYAESLGIAPTLAAWSAVPEARILDTERQVNVAPGSVSLMAPASEIIAETVVPGPGSVGLAFSPVTDGDTLTTLDRAVSAAGANGVPLLSGTTANEFAAPLPDLTSPAEAEAALRAAGVSDRGIARYQGEVDRVGSAYAHSQLGVSQLFRAPTVRLAAGRAAAGAGKQTWLYDFAWRSGVTGVANHCLDLPFAWDLLDVHGVPEALGDAAPRALADRMHADWVSFIGSGAVRWASVSHGGFGAERFDADGDTDVSRFDDDAYLLEAELTRSTHHQPTHQ